LQAGKRARYYFTSILHTLKRFLKCMIYISTRGSMDRHTSSSHVLSYLSPFCWPALVSTHCNNLCLGSSLADRLLD
jgi:hypothetical protein